MTLNPPGNLLISCSSLFGTMTVVDTDKAHPVGLYGKLFGCWTMFLIIAQLNLLIT